MKTITDSTPVSEIMQASRPIVVKFEAKWCAPCKAMTPLLLDIEQQLGDKVGFYSANVDHCMLIAQRYKVNQIPALLVIDKGAVTAMRTGAASKAELLQWIKQAIPEFGDQA
ncbi:thioredoxin family protein [Bradyrhizobium erythrophlei]|jgi:thioredoxin 1|uniref:Thioredoxin n=1 Tax=Bradyrhizobium erythrophlei TaxID=1437360 RepID=A0A1M5PUR3_9BRAD|nr:thioredoxin domain-containing protein [Bradyrhizobium erythrophlei]SHH05747.1 thioredoxin 1 [Bradyrhizobium erythrophlei]